MAKYQFSVILNDNSQHEVTLEELENAKLYDIDNFIMKIGYSKLSRLLANELSIDFLKIEYIAIVNGNFEKPYGTINLPIARKDNSIIERCISNEGQEAITDYEVLNSFKDYSIVKCTLKTGRTHQIRVHMATINHSLLGDTLYGTSSNLINRQALHSYKLSFIHPVSHENLVFVCELPEDMKF